ncbi:MAG: tetratricopeptide repeat protein [Prevotellaceae bacterium]|jgi:tetratricopeptide (TPR) repeat protein|nr:tetratricopeptide repeat protein [Prevotellaceae bacterium]
MKKEYDVLKEHSAHWLRQCDWVVRYVCSSRIYEALQTLRTMMEATETGGSWMDLLDEETYTYNRMIEFMMSGTEDPQRPMLYRKLSTNILLIADQIRVLITSSSYRRQQQSECLSVFPSDASLRDFVRPLLDYTDNLAVATLMGVKSDEAMRLRFRHEEDKQRLFVAVWTNTQWSPEDREAANELLHEKHLRETDICMLVGAVLLSLLSCFDPYKLLWILSAYEHESAQISQRALVGLAIAVQMYHERLSLYDEIEYRLQYLNEKPYFGEDLCRVQIQLLRSRDTDKIDRRMREEIIPEMLKSTKRQFDRNRDEELIIANPEWQDNPDSDIAKKMREITELQLEGSDIYMSSFAHLKSHSFFRQISNWFYPFDREHPDIVRITSGEPNALMDMIIDAGTFCDSDKYSVCFAMSSFPQEAQRMMLDSIANDIQSAEYKEEVAKFNGRPEIICNQYIHSLYRFFKLFPFHTEFKDVFAESLNLYDYEIVRPILRKPALLYNIGIFLFRSEHYEEANRIFETVIELRGNGDAELYQKIGFGYQKEKNYREAIKAYRKADLLRPDNVWTNRSLASCHRMIGDYATAFSYYQKVYEVQQDNRQMIFQMAVCLTELERYDDALSWYFKLHYADENDVAVCQGICWCSFVAGKYEQAFKFNTRALDANPHSSSDLLNLGHLLWVTGRGAQALEAYRASYIHRDKTIDWRTTFLKDSRYLIAQGIKPEDLPLMVDAAGMNAE